MIQIYQGALTSSSPGSDPKQVRQEARTYLLSCLADFLKVSASSLELEYLKTGRPVLKNHPDLSFSLSHSEMQVAVACSKIFNVGIDLQLVREFNEKLFSRVCTWQELQQLKEKSADQFYFLWTVKEAAMKCIGLGFQYPMNQIEVNPANHQIQLLEKKEYSMAFDYSWNHLQFAEFKAPANFVGHVVWASHPNQPDYKANFSLRT